MVYILLIILTSSHIQSLYQQKEIDSAINHTSIKVAISLKKKKKH